MGMAGITDEPYHSVSKYIWDFVYKGTVICSPYGPRMGRFSGICRPLRCKGVGGEAQTFHSRCARTDRRT